MMPCADKVVGRGLASRVWRSRIVRSILVEQPGLSKTSIHLICGNVKKSESRFSLSIQVCPITIGAREKAIRANNVRVDEFRRPINRPINVRFCCEVKYIVRLEPLKQIVDFRLVADIYPFEVVARGILQIRQRINISGIGQFVQVHHVIIGMVDQIPNQIRPTAARTTCYKSGNSLQVFIQL